MKRQKKDDCKAFSKFNWSWFNDFLKAASNASGWPEFKMNTLMDGTSEKWLSAEGKRIMNAFIDCKAAGDYRKLFSIDENVNFTRIIEFLSAATEQISWLDDYLAELNG